MISALNFGDGDAYEMIAYAIMPNHVHLIFRLVRGELDVVMKRWKSYTGHEANQKIRRLGSFWQSDYFDVLLRDSDELQRTIQYVLDNPAKAGLHEWPYTRTWPDRIMQLI